MFADHELVVGESGHLGQVGDHYHLGLDGQPLQAAADLQAHGATYYNRPIGNWGLAIILLTFLIRLVLWPINQKVYANSERMKELQPKLTEIREKFADDQQRLGEETMKLWREHGVNPLGCLPMVLQFPILIALYFMILYSVELYQADFFLWYTDLSARDPYFVLPILMGVVMFAQQSMMTVETPNPQMATMMKVMPIMFTVLFLFFPAGLVLYWLVNNVLSIAQQWYVMRQVEGKAAVKT